ncbi:MAG: hypothetical protein HWN80_00820 [Candidatus Lokiarchaeota archaeon]|nr:hypothetical protein [Candidatus Lokiarchaeota archaeon]
MSLLKAFLFSLLALIVSNILLVIILYASFGRFDDIVIMFTVGASTTLMLHLFCSMGHAIWISIDRIAYHIVNDMLFFIFLDLIVVVAPLIAAIVAGRVGEKRIHSFLGVFLTSIVSMIVSMIIMFDNVPLQLGITSEFLGSGALFILVPGSLLNGLIFGLLAFFTTKRK